MSLSISNSEFLLLVYLISYYYWHCIIIARTFNILATEINITLELFIFALKLPSFSLQQSKTCQHSKYLQILFKNIVP